MGAQRKARRREFLTRLCQDGGCSDGPGARLFRIRCSQRAKSWSSRGRPCSDMISLNRSIAQERSAGTVSSTRSSAAMVSFALSRLSPGFDLIKAGSVEMNFSTRFCNSARPIKISSIMPSPMIPSEWTVARRPGRDPDQERESTSCTRQQRIKIASVASRTGHPKPGYFCLAWRVSMFDLRHVRIFLRPLTCVDAIIRVSP